MHKLMEYICEELEELERKAAKGGKLSMAEIEYVDKLAHIKKSLLSAEEMWEDSEYSNEDGSYARGGRGGGSNDGGSYARGGRGRGSNARRDSMGRYSSRSNRSYEGRRGESYEGYSREDAKEDLMMELRELERDAGDEESKRMIRKWIKQLEQE